MAVQTSRHLINTTKITSLLLCPEGKVRKDITYVQTNTSDTPDLLLGQRAQQFADGLLLASGLASTEHGFAAEHIHLDILAIVSSNTDVKGRVNRLADENGR